jgi:uncharacterized ferritin-like protein (DUF455 family)
MRLCDYALHILESPDIESKLAPARGRLMDRRPAAQPAAVPRWPARAPSYSIRPGKEVRVPPAEGMADPEQLRRLIHALANHELQAVELFAWAILRFDAAPARFRRGLAKILREEQNHTRMYLARLRQLGGCFGDYPVSGYFWNKAALLTTPSRFLCAMSLTFENANLDHTELHWQTAKRLRDGRTVALIRKVQADEVGHVRFGQSWLRRFHPGAPSLWHIYRAHLVFPLHPGRARGKLFNEEGRRAAGLGASFIARLRAYDDSETGATTSAPPE